jgi:hypothetical protein
MQGNYTAYKGEKQMEIIRNIADVLPLLTDGAQELYLVDPHDFRSLPIGQVAERMKAGAFVIVASEEASDNQQNQALTDKEPSQPAQIEQPFEWGRPKELDPAEIAQHIKDRKTNKEIAEIYGVNVKKITNFKQHQKGAIREALAAMGHNHSEIDSMMDGRKQNRFVGRKKQQPEPVAEPEPATIDFDLYVSMEMNGRTREEMLEEFGVSEEQLDQWEAENADAITDLIKQRNEGIKDLLTKMN